MDATCEEGQADITWLYILGSEAARSLQPGSSGGVATRPKALRPVFGDRSISKTTTSESRTESFRTAREEPYSSEDDCKSTVRPSLPSPRTSQTTVRQISQHKVKKASQPSGIGLGLDFDPKTDDSLTPRTKGEFIKFDAGWESSNEVEKEWDDNLGRHVTRFEPYRCMTE
ncbi:hypothetical protein HYQ46_003641 [Verticillium longisporum]|nr:hypothetical protein HYQ46_003641 [Verticillium longisporum]